MRQVILTKGLPASGKTTWAKSLIESKPRQYKRVSKDDLRAMLDNGKWSPDNENFVLQVRDLLILHAIESGKHVIVDDTNLNPKHEKHIADMVKGRAVVEIEDFTGVSVEECIDRDLKRSNSLGPKVIRDMWKQYLKPQPAVIADNLNLPTAVICDLDGTLALFGNASPYERDFSKDQVNMRIYELLHRLQEDRTIFIVSGRMEKHRAQTEDWLRYYAIPYDQLFMRATNDVRKDYIIKKEIFDQDIRGKYNVLFVLDDRNQVVEMWRNEGITCLQVAEGDF